MENGGTGLEMVPIQVKELDKRHYSVCLSCRGAFGFCRKLRRFPFSSNAGEPEKTDFLLCSRKDPGCRIASMDHVVEEIASHKAD